MPRINIGMNVFIRTKLLLSDRMGLVLRILDKISFFVKHARFIISVNFCVKVHPVRRNIKYNRQMGSSYRRKGGMDNEKFRERLTLIPI